MSSNLDDRLALLKKQYAASIPAKHAEFDAALASARAGDDDGLATLRHLAHKLAGSGASYGFAELSGLAKRLEGAVIACAGGDVSAAVQSACDALMARLDAEASGDV